MGCKNDYVKFQPRNRQFKQDKIFLKQNWSANICDTEFKKNYWGIKHRKCIIKAKKKLQIKREHTERN